MDRGCRCSLSTEVHFEGGEGGGVGPAPFQPSPGQIDECDETTSYNTLDRVRGGREREASLQLTIHVVQHGFDGGVVLKLVDRARNLLTLLSYVLRVLWIEPYACVSM